MIDKILEFALRQRVFVLLGAIALILVGSWSVIRLPIDAVPDITNSHNRGGVSDKGDDVGRYTSVATNSTNEPIIAYYDKTHGALKFASFGAIRWHSHVVDVGIGNLTPVYFGRGDIIMLERERIKRETIQKRRLQHQSKAA